MQGWSAGTPDGGDGTGRTEDGPSSHVANLDEQSVEALSAELEKESPQARLSGRRPGVSRVPGRRGSRKPRRVLATVLFVDVVGSTVVASALGDKRWGELLTRLRRIVSRELKRGGGREQDFLGDGFLAIFSEPAQAVRTAVSIVAALHELGIEVRCGVHTGECEVIDGRLRGIAVHIGARVMALGGAAEVLVTGTVRDLIVGSEIELEGVGIHELKGVEGTWLVYRVLAVDGRPVEQPLSKETALARVTALDDSDRSRRRRRIAIGAVALVCAVVLAVAIPLLTLGGGSSPAGRFGKDSLLRIDPGTPGIATVVPDSFALPVVPLTIFTYRGTLWEWAPGYGFVRRDMHSGQALASQAVKGFVGNWTLAFGSVWEVHGTGNDDNPPEWIDRLDELSFRRTVKILLPAHYMAWETGVGLGSYWVISSNGTLVRIDRKSVV
jgi:class 3 adenylate cyclase